MNGKGGAGGWQQDGKGGGKGGWQKECNGLVTEQISQVDRSPMNS
jgi:hypothetical protein